MQETDPITAGIAPRDADQFRAEPRDDEAKPVLFVRQNIEQPVAPLIFATGKLHRWMRSAELIDRRYRLREQTAGVLRFHDALDADRHRRRCDAKPCAPWRA